MLASSQMNLGVYRGFLFGLFVNELIFVGKMCNDQMESLVQLE